MNTNLSHRHYDKGHFDKIFEQILILSQPDNPEYPALNTLLDVWGMPYWKVFFQAYEAYRDKESAYAQIKAVLEKQTFYYYRDFDNAVLSLLPVYETMTGKSREEALAALFDGKGKPESLSHHQSYYDYPKNSDLIKQYSQLVQDFINILNHNDNNEYQLNLYEKAVLVSDRLSMIVKEDGGSPYFDRIHTRLEDMLNSLDFEEAERKSLLYIQKSLQQFEIGDPDLLYPPYLNPALLEAVSGESFDFPLHEIRDREYFKRHLGIRNILESIRDSAAEVITENLNTEENPLQYAQDWEGDLPLNSLINGEIKKLHQAVKGLNEFIGSDVIANWLHQFESQDKGKLWTYRNLFAFFRVLPFLYPKNSFQINAFEEYTGIIISNNQLNQDTNMTEENLATQEIPQESDKGDVRGDSMLIDNGLADMPPIGAEFINRGDEVFFIDRLDTSEEKAQVYDECMKESAKLFFADNPEVFENKVHSAAVFDESVFNTLKFTYHTSKGNFNIIECPYFAETFSFAEQLVAAKTADRQGFSENEINALLACRLHFIQQYERYQFRDTSQVFEIETPLFSMRDFMIQNSDIPHHLFNFNPNLEKKLDMLGFEVPHLSFEPPPVETPIETLLQQPSEIPVQAEEPAADEPVQEQAGDFQQESVSPEPVVESYPPMAAPEQADRQDERILALEGKIDYLVSAIQLLQNQSPTMPLIWRDAQNDVYWVYGQYRFQNTEFTTFLGEIREIVSAVEAYTQEIEEALGRSQEVDRVSLDFLNYLFGTMNKVQYFKFSQNATMLLAWHNLLMFTYQNNIPMNDDLIFMNKTVCQALQENILMPENRVGEDCKFAIHLLTTSLQDLKLVNFQSRIQQQIDELVNSGNQANQTKYQAIMDNIVAIREQAGEGFKASSKNHVAISNTLNLLNNDLNKSNLGALAEILETMAKDNQKANMKINSNISRTGWLVQVLAQHMGLDVMKAWAQYRNKSEDGEQDSPAPAKPVKKKGFLARLTGK